MNPVSRFMKVFFQDKSPKPESTQKNQEATPISNLSEFAARQVKNSKIPPDHKVSSNLLKPSNSNNYGESPGINYEKLFSNIGRAFQETSKTLKNHFKSVGVISKKDESVSSKEVKLKSDLKKPQSKSIKIATSNVGLDGAYGNLELSLGYTEDYVNDNLNRLIDFQKKLPKDVKSSKIEAFTKDLEEFTQEKGENFEFSDVQNERLTRLTEFLANLENRQELKSYGGNSITKKDLDFFNGAVFDLYHFSKTYKGWTEKKDGSSLSDYVSNKKQELVQNRLNELIDKDVCFLQELEEKSDLAMKVKEQPNITLFIPKGELGKVCPSLMVNKERFKVEEYPQGYNIRRRAADDFIKGKTPNGTNITIYDDGSFGSRATFRAVIATDLKTNRKVLLCSTHLRGYEIGTGTDMQREALNDVREMHEILKDVAIHHDVDAIIIGGDFNSVEERIGALASPLEDLKEAKYSHLHFEGDTEVTPPNLYQVGYKLSRKIDHVFGRGIRAKVKISKGKVEGGTKGALDPLKQTAFDHFTVSGEIKVKTSWLKMMKHRVHQLKKAE